VFEIYHFNETDILSFALMMVRVSSCLVLMPIFGSRLIPPPAKILLSLVVSMVLFPVMKHNFVTPASWSDDMILLVMREAFLGLFMGFLTRLLFLGVEVAGQILSFTMGFSAVSLLNPTFGEQNTLMEQFETTLATLLFLAINGHHMLFEAIYRSFELAPLGVLSVNVKAFASVTLLVSEIFTIGVKLAGPMIAVILFLNIALGIVGRAVPQINVFVISFPVNILVGLFVFMVSIPLLLTVFETDAVHIGGEILTFIKDF